ncbi:MAG: GNAT family N-acetyltransferase [Pseudomonadota bacterium]
MSQASMLAIDQAAVETTEQASGQVLPAQAAVSVRAARQGDGAAIQALLGRLSVKSRYYRFFFPMQSLSDEMLARFTHAYPESEVTLLALTELDGKEIVIGMANYVVEAKAGKAEYAVVVADEWQKQGIATRLIKNLTCIASTAGLETLYGDVLAENTGMLRLLHKLGFSSGAHSDGAYLRTTWKSLEIYPWKCADWLQLTPAA